LGLEFEISTAQKAGELKAPPANVKAQKSKTALAVKTISPTLAPQGRPFKSSMNFQSSLGGFGSGFFTAQFVYRFQKTVDLFQRQSNTLLGRLLLIIFIVQIPFSNVQVLRAFIFVDVYENVFTATFFVNAQFFFQRSALHAAVVPASYQNVKNRERYPAKPKYIKNLAPCPKKLSQRSGQICF
jgi:hypothetical protein